MTNIFTAFALLEAFFVFNLGWGLGTELAIGSVGLMVIFIFGVCFIDTMCFYISKAFRNLVSK